MMVKNIWLTSGEIYKVTGSSMKSEGFITHRGKKLTSYSNVLKYLLACCNHCNSVILENQIKDEVNNDDELKMIGEPTDVALKVLYIKSKLSDISFNLNSNVTLVKEFPFNSILKMMSVVVSSSDDNIYTLFVKGAPEKVLDCCQKYAINGENDSIDIYLLSSKLRRKINSVNERFASKGLV